MKKLIIILLSIAFMPLARADELKIKGHIKPDPIHGAGHYLITNDSGRVKARVKPDPLTPGDSRRYLIIEKNRNQTGRIRLDYINQDSFVIETDGKYE